MWFNEYKNRVTNEGEIPLTPIMGLFGGYVQKQTKNKKEKNINELLLRCVAALNDRVALIYFILFYFIFRL
jgi:hypothetical protein